MHEITASPRPKAVNPPAISARELWPWTLFGTILLLALLYIAGIEGSALSLGPGEFVHELMHDGRHVLTFPCH